MMLLLAGVLAGKKVGQVTLTGFSVIDEDSASPREAGIRINTDGTMDQRLQGTNYYQINAATDWIIPNIGATTDYEFRVTNVVWTDGSTFNIIEAATEDTWIDLTGGALEWSVIDTDPSVGVGRVDVTFDLEVRKGSGPTIDSASYRLVADYGV